MKVYVLYFENCSGDNHVSGVLDYKPTLEEMIEYYKDHGDIEEEPGSPEEEDTTMGPATLESGTFSWQYMSVDITPYEVKSKLNK